MLRRGNGTHLHRPWRATLRFCTISQPRALPRIEIAWKLLVLPFILRAEK